MLDRTNSSFDYAAVESASSQHNRMKRAGSVNSTTSDHQESNSHNRQSPSSNGEQISI
jgi:hypothetical protein